MKMVKSLLLGSAAGLVAVTAGQAADLPVKAKPVEYVKVCSLYGAGFYYIPGTDVCLKIGGFIRTEWDIHAGGSFATFTAGANAFQYRGEDNYVTRARAYLTADVREQTSYGTLRGYIAAGWQFSTDDPPTISLPSKVVGPTGGAAVLGNNSNVSILRAFIQLGGFTFGKTSSFFDFFNTSKYSLQTILLYQDFAGVGIFTYGYTQQLGNGIAVTIAAQDPSPFQKNIVDVNTASIFTVAPTNNNENNAGTLVPDIVGTIRVDQAWGGAQIAAALHDNRARYFPTSDEGEGSNLLVGVGHPGDKWGWAAMAGLELNLPWAKGDSFAVQSQYCVGASFYCSNFGGGTQYGDNAFSLINVSKVGLGWVDDAYFGNFGGDSSLQLATAWNVWAAIQHYWTPDVRTSLYGGYLNYKANSQAVNLEVCNQLGGEADEGQITGGSTTGCVDWAAWQIGSRTLWNPTKNLDVGVDVMYTAMAKTAFDGAVVHFSPGGNAAVGQFNVSPTHIWSGILRVQYNFYP